MTGNNLWLLISLTLTHITLSAKADYHVFPNKVTIKQGEGFVFQILPADTPLKSCTIRAGGATIPLIPNSQSSNGITYWGRSLESGDCGVKVDSTSNSISPSIEKWVFQMVTTNDVSRTAFADVNITGSEEPPRPIEIDAEIGVDKTLECIADNVGGETVYCRLLDPRGATISRGSNCTIVINKVKLTDGGTWKCVTGTKTAIQEQEAPIIVTVKPPKTLKITTMDNEMGVSIHCHYPSSKLHYCQFQRPDGLPLLMTDGLSSGRYAYVGEGIDNNDCGILISKPEEVDFGIWKCLIGLKDGTENGGFFNVKSPDKSSSFQINHTISQPSTLYALEGSSLTMDCTIDATLDYCWFQHPNGTRYYGLQESAESLAWRYHGEGLSLGHCGLTVNQTTASDSGKWICGMGVSGEPLSVQDLQRDFQVIITATLLIENTLESTAAHGEDIILSCHSLQGEALRYCRFVSPNGTGFNLFPEQIQTPSSRYMYHGEGLQYGECGILIKGVTADDYGIWQCGARLVGNQTQEITRGLTLSPPGMTSSSAIVIAVALTVVAIGIIGYMVYRRRKAASAQQVMVRPVAVSITSDASDDIIDLQIN